MGKKRKFSELSSSVPVIVKYSDMPKNQKKTWSINDDLNALSEYFCLLDWMRGWSTRDGFDFDGIKCMRYVHGYLLIEVVVSTRGISEKKFLISRASLYILAFHGPRYGWRVFKDKEIKIDFGDERSTIMERQASYQKKAWENIGPGAIINALKLMDSEDLDESCDGCEVFMVHLCESSRLRLIQLVIGKCLIPTVWESSLDENKNDVELRRIGSEGVTDILDLLAPIKIDCTRLVPCPPQVPCLIKKFKQLCCTWMEYCLSGKKLVELDTNIADSCGVLSIRTLNRSLCVLSNTNLEKILDKWRRKYDKGTCPPFFTKTDLDFMESRIRNIQGKEIGGYGSSKGCDESPKQRKSVEGRAQKNEDDGSIFKDTKLTDADPEVYVIIGKEKQRQFRSLELIASENFTSRAVMEAVGSCLTNKYSEGLPGKRYYGGNEHIDGLETLCQQRALEAFHLDEQKWGVNVQPLSGSPANFEVYTALLNPHDRIMGLDLPHGGHLSHGFMTPERRVSGTSIYFESMAYRLDESTGLVDYDMLEKTATLFRPKLIIAGASAYPRDFDYPRMRKIADGVGAFLMMDMAHISGLVAASVVGNPFEYCDVVTTTTHKSLRGPRGGMIFYKKDTILGVDLESAINDAVFPGLQGGPHNHTIGGLAVCLKHAQSPEFKAYQNNVVSNCRALASRLVGLGYKLVSGGSDNHLVLVDLRPLGIGGAHVEKILDMASITLNKSSVPGDKSALVPGGILIGSPAMTTRGFKESEFVASADFIHEGVQITLEANKLIPKKKLQKFLKFVASSDFPLRDRVSDLQKRVEALTTQFLLPGL